MRSRRRRRLRTTWAAPENIVLRVHLGAFTFTVGYVPVQIDVYASSTGPRGRRRRCRRRPWACRWRRRRPRRSSTRRAATQGRPPIGTARVGAAWRPTARCVAISPRPSQRLARRPPEQDAEGIVGAHFGDAADATRRATRIDPPLPRRRHSSRRARRRCATSSAAMAAGGGGRRRRGRRVRGGRGVRCRMRSTSASGSRRALPPPCSMRCPASIRAATVAIAGGVDFGEAVLLPEAGFPECGAPAADACRRTSAIASGSRLRPRRIVRSHGL